MANLHRSISTSTMNQENQRKDNIQRSMSVGENSATADILVDIDAQVEKFVKAYSLFWNLGPDVQASLTYACYRLPIIASRLRNNKLEDLQLAISILLNIRRNLPQTLKTGKQGCQELTGYLQQAINRGNQAVRICTSQNSNFQFGPIVDKELQSSNDVMAAALVLKLYFSNVANCFIR